MQNKNRTIGVELLPNQPQNQQLQEQLLGQQLHKKKQRKLIQQKPLRVEVQKLTNYRCLQLLCRPKDKIASKIRQCTKAKVTQAHLGKTRMKHQ
jgi:hypothetical protein